MKKKTKLSALLIGTLIGFFIIYLTELINVDTLTLIKVMPLISLIKVNVLAFGFNGLRARKRGWIKLMRFNYWVGLILVILGYGWMVL
ncbi:hypothetical protein PMSD_25905 [Paenibacillus macquariensis subsp. defensor]|nr:hypothetical protein PMSD_25905 [Paenibacillus macquariensis subsp. defensor]